jgi:AcrR family transcriptional regulator
VPIAIGTTPGRRERKREAVHEALVAAALDLFDRQGVDATTVEQISEAVDVSTRTFHRHFPGKLDVLFADAAALRARFDTALAHRPPDEDILTSLREAMAAVTDSMAVRREREVARLRIVEDHDGLRSISLRRTEDWAASVARHTADRLGLAEDELLPRLLGGCAVAALRSARSRWFADPAIDLTAEMRRSFVLMADLERAIRQGKT